MARKRIRWEATPPSALTASLKMKKTASGLYVPGDTDTIPEGALKRARGLDATPTGTWRSRNGSTTLYALDAHSLYRFGDVRFQGAGTVLYRDGLSILTGLNGNRLTFVRVPPVSGQSDYLFVAGGGLPRKVSAAGAVTQWGITKPTYGSFAAALGTQKTKTIDLFEDETTWTEVNATLANEGTIKQEGTNSLKATVAASTTATITKSITVNLSQYASGAEPSPDQDYIQLWVRVDAPENLEYMQVIFSLGGTGFGTETYSRSINVKDEIPPSQEHAKQVTGVEEAAQIQRRIETDQGTVIEDPNTGEMVFLDQWEQQQALEDMGRTTVPVTVGQWVKLRLPKSSFQRSGDSADDWDDVQAVQLVIRTNSGTGGTVVYFDDMKLAGTAGLMGRYRYHVTYGNAVGTRSNPGNDYVEVEHVERQPVSLTAVPVSADTQVTKREIWRTVGGGTRFFKIAEIADNVTTTYSDTIPDFAWMDSGATTFMTSEELPLDNDPPLGGAWDVWGPHLGRVWHGGEQTTGSKGRVYWSPIGRAEVVQDFLDVGTEDDPVKKGVIWNGQNFVFTEAHCYKMLGTGDSFTALEVFGVPGTINPTTVRATPYGIVYEAVDGVRAFNGSTSTLLSPEAVQVLFLGEAHENLSAFDTTDLIAEFHKDQYYISDGAQTLVCDLARAAWRDLGIGLSAIYHEPDTGSLIASAGGSVIELEAEGVFTELTADVSFDLKTWAYQQETPFIVERAVINYNPGGLAPTFTSLLDAFTVSSTLDGGSDRVLNRQALYRPANRLAFQLTHSAADARIEVFNIEAEIRDFVLDVKGPQGAFKIPAQILSDELVTFEAGGADDPQHFDQLWLVRRLVLDHETNSQVVTPSLELDSATIALLPYNGSRQDFTYDINRVGLIRSLQLSISSTVNNLEIYRSWLEVEPVQLVIRVHTNGQMQRVVVPGRFNADRTEVFFEPDPTDPILSRESVPLLRRLFIDFESAETITPVFEFVGQADLTLGGFAASTRALEEWEVNRAGRLIALRLQADWDEAIDLRSVELDVMLPEGL